MGSPATADERSALLPGAGEITRPVRGCVGDIVRNRWFRVAMVAKSAFFTLGTVVLLAHGGSISTVLYPRDGNGYLEVPAEAHHAPLWRGDPLVNHPAAPQLNVAWFPVHRGRFVVDQVAERAEDAKKKHDDRMPKWPKHVIGGDHWHDLGVVAMSGAFGGAREKQPEFWYKSVPGDVPVVSMDVRGHGESERGWNALGVDDAFASMRWNLMANDVLAVADDAKFRKVILVGSSMTNAVALWATVSEHTKARVAGVLMVRPATGWEIRGEGICKLRKIAWTHASFAMLLRRARRFAEGVKPRNLDDDDLAPLPPPELTSLIGKSELYSRKSHASRWVLSGNKWRKYMGNPGLGSSQRVSWGRVQMQMMCTSQPTRWTRVLTGIGPTWWSGTSRPHLTATRTSTPRRGTRRPSPRSGDGSPRSCRFDTSEIKSPTTRADGRCSSGSHSPAGSGHAGQGCGVQLEPDAPVRHGQGAQVPDGR